MTESNKVKPVRYMDFIGGGRASSTDPLISRPVAKRPETKPAVREVKKTTEKTNLPKMKTAGTAKSANVAKPSAVTVGKTEEKAFISRKPVTSKDLYPTKAIEKTGKPKVEEKKAVKTTDKPVDETAKKAQEALSGKKSTDAPDGNSYSISGKSPFLPNYSIDKRPLSNSVPEKKKQENFEKLSFLGVSESSESTRKKNVYEKNEKKDEKGKKKEKKPVKIIEDSDKKSGMPLFLVIILTIILGAAVGAGVYFILPK
ncbi:hypothetical protein IJ380_03260 [Candidatus Saccharibacteria bacterium]|nr:hypothetical protein [Candidatus Saccharibacteria bacterium]